MKILGFIVLIFSFVLLFVAFETHAATLSLQPSSGTFQIGSTFDVTLSADTEGKYINAIEVHVQFPPDKLQVVSPTGGPSIIDLWVMQPKVNNQTGVIELRGGIPKGINASDGTVARIQFRAKSIGTAVVRILDESRVLLHDGKGTNDLHQTQNAVFQLELPPPAGPIIASATHPDEAKWYSNNTVSFNWASDSGVNGYSYILDEEPIAIPDNISEGEKNSVTYQDLSDGKYFFHIKSLRNEAWGGVTHFAVQLDATPPAQFSPEIFPSARTTEHQPTIRFQTTDRLSGFNHYELKIVPLDKKHASESDQEQPFFFEAESPYVISPLDVGTYDVIVRAYDNAGNFIDVSKRFRIVTPIFQVAEEEGLKVWGIGVIPWLMFWVVLFGIAVVFGVLGWFFRHRYLSLEKRRLAKAFPDAIQKQLQELKRYQQKYGKLMILLILGGSLVFSFYGSIASAESKYFSPPIITTFPQNISNDEIFYVGGITEFPGTDVLMYIQNKKTGELISQTITSDSKREWFYRHSTFFSAGEYIVWVQSRRGEEMSPPSPQLQFSVSANAVEFGATNISYELFALAVSIMLGAVVVAAALYMGLHMRRMRRKHKEFQKELREAEESIRRGFAVLKRDIQQELAFIKKAKLGEKLSAERQKQEEQLLKDLGWAESYIGKEVWDVGEVDEHH